MLTNAAQRGQPIPGRRDSESPAASHHGPQSLTPERRALRDAFLAEMWPTVPEYHSGDQPRPYRTRS